MLLRMQTAQSVPYDCNQSTASQIAHRYARARPGYAHRLMGGIPRALSQNGYGFAIDPAVRSPWLKPYQTVARRGEGTDWQNKNVRPHLETHP